tara:strand:- start:224 stop:1276 length:1053 start_codon:yes stop_codon:yes gene_type:complete
MIKKGLMVLFVVLVSSSFVSAKVGDNVRIGGTYLGVLNSLKSKTAQFEFASNIDFTYVMNKRLTVMLQVQGGSGAGSLGFSGRAISFSDILFLYDLPEYQSHITVGSFDMPIGLGTGHLTNNADSFNHPFILNNLFYSSLANGVGTFNTLGLMVKRFDKMFNTTVAITNGTAGDASNANNTFATLLQLSSDSLVNKLNISGTYLKTNDQMDPASSESFRTDLTLSFVDARYALSKDVYLAGHYGQLIFDDNNSATKDKVTVLGAEIGYDNSDYFTAIGISYWTPEDKDGSGSGMSDDIKKPGLFESAVADDEIKRYQIAIGMHIDKNTQLKIEFLQRYLTINLKRMQNQE